MYRHTMAGTSSNEERPDPNITLDETLWNKIHTAPSHARSFNILRGHVSLTAMGEGQPEQAELAKVGTAELCAAPRCPSPTLVPRPLCHHPTTIMTNLQS